MHKNISQPQCAKLICISYNNFKYITGDKKSSMCFRIMPLLIFIKAANEICEKFKTNFNLNQIKVIVFLVAVTFDF